MYIVHTIPFALRLKESIFSYSHFAYFSTEASVFVANPLAFGKANDFELAIVTSLDYRFVLRFATCNNKKQTNTKKTKKKKCLASNRRKYLESSTHTRSHYSWRFLYLELNMFHVVDF